MDKSTSLENLIAKKTLAITTKIRSATPDERVDISIAVSMLGQAQLLIQSNPAMARQLYTRASSIATIKLRGF